MGHREQLLTAARRCLEERGYARTTARDLVAASGTNLASIGYHFGSKEALLNEAILEAFAEYTEKLLAATGGEWAGTDPLERLRASWTEMVEDFVQMRPLLVAFVEALAQAERHPSLRAQLAEGYEALREAVASAVLEAATDLPAGCARTIASFMIVVSDGLMVQWLLDPEATPSGGELFDTVRLLFGGAADSVPPDD